MKEMPTLKELFDRMPVKQESVKYGDSRTVLKYFDKTVEAYAYCFNSFIVIFKSKRKMLAVCYSIRHPFCSYGDGSFQVLDLEFALDMIKNKDGFTERKVQDNFEIEPQEVWPKKIGSIKLEHKTEDKNSYYKYRHYLLYRFKNNKIMIRQMYSHRDSSYRSHESDFISNVQNKQYKITYEGVDESIVDEIMKQLALKKI